MVSAEMFSIPSDFSIDIGHNNQFIIGHKIDTVEYTICTWKAHNY